MLLSSTALGTEVLVGVSADATPTGPVEETSPAWTRGAATRTSLYLVEIDGVLKPDILVHGLRALPGYEIRRTPDGSDRAMSEAAEDVLDATRTFRFATEIYATKPADTPANQPYDPRVEQAMTVDRTIPVSPLRNRMVETSLGRIALDNADGGLDVMIRAYAIDGRAVRVLVVDRDAAYSTAVVVFSGTATGLSTSDRKSVEIGVEDNTAKLGKPFQPTLFDGSGGLEGGDDAKGKPKPVALGYIRNIAPPLIDYADQIFYVGEPPLRDVEAMRDSGATITYGGDVADIEATTVTAGRYKQARAQGAARLGSEQYGQITADIEGRLIDGVYVETAVALALYVLRRAGLTDDQIDVDAFRALDDQRPWRAGVYTGLDRVTYADVIDAFMRSVNGWWGPDAAGLITCGLVAAPAGTPGGTIDESLIAVGGVVAMAMPSDVSPAVSRWRVLWDINYTVQPQLEVDPTGGNGITPDLKAFVEEPARTVAYPADVPDAGVVAVYALAQEPDPVPTLLRTAADAETLVAELFDLFDGHCRMVSIETDDDRVRIGLGEVETLYFPRFGLEIGLAGRCVGHRLDCANRKVTYRFLVEG